MTKNIIIFHLEFNFTNRRYVGSWHNSLLWPLHLLPDFTKLKRSLSNVFKEAASVFSHKDTLGFTFVFFKHWRDIFHLLKSDLKIFFDKGVKSIFDFVLGSAWQIFADLRPFAANFTIKLKDHLILLFSPFF